MLENQVFLISFHNLHRYITYFLIIIVIILLMRQLQQLNINDHKYLVSS